MSRDEDVRAWLDRRGMFIMFIIMFITFIIGIWTRDARWAWTGVVLGAAIAAMLFAALWRWLDR